MRVRFWGTRGSIATPGPATLRYGGNTSCVEVRSDSGTIILIDCGTGAHALGQALQAGPKPCSGHILISHTHWDHIQGLPFFAPLFEEGNEWAIYGPRGLGQSLQEVLAGQMEYAYFPVALNAFAAKVEYHEVVEGAFMIGDVRVATHYLNHPALTVGYRIEADGATLVYASDHEPHCAEAGHGHPNTPEKGDAAHIEFLREADLVIHDAQYTAAEYPSKIGWGHSTIEYVIDVAHAANVRRVVLYHHDPTRTDEAVDALVAQAQRRAAEAGAPLEVSGAAEGSTIELRRLANAAKFAPYLPSSLVQPVGDLSRERVLVIGAPAGDLEILAAAAEADGLELVSSPSVDGLEEKVRACEPSLVFLGDAVGADAIARTVREASAERGKDIPIIVVADQARAVAARGEASSVTDWLTRPFSIQYARSRMRAWLMRSMLRWRQAALPANEEERLQSVHRLALLDTEPEERFDRHARIAAAALDAPIALVTLVDRDRQWFKSHLGFAFSETPRDIGFCSHAILEGAPMVVSDALSDDRFAENPAVIGDPHVRFYAGIPLRAPDGAAVGAFCIADHKPRSLSAAQLKMLQDIARLVEEELQHPPGEDVGSVARVPLKA
ncbi:MAG: GAF domain-containing protein [Hyphomonadaceae bacterium]|nr:GAF domain-containing protein [Hyphomonadaceae bacterium]